MKVTPSTIEKFDSFLKEHLEADITEIISRELSVSPEEALSIYFTSDISSIIEDGQFGAQYLSPKYLAEEVLAKIPSEHSFDKIS